MFYNDFPLNTQGKELVGQSAGTPDACKKASEFRINPDCSFEAQGSKFCISGVSSSSSNCWSVRLERSGPPWGQGLSKTHDLTRTSTSEPSNQFLHRLSFHSAQLSAPRLIVKAWECADWGNFPVILPWNVSNQSNLSTYPDVVTYLTQWWPSLDLGWQWQEPTFGFDRIFPNQMNWRLHCPYYPATEH